MNKKWIYQVLSGLLVLLGMAACSEGTNGIDTPVEDKDSRLESITLHIGAAETATTRAYGGDENARKGEFMNTLRVFIVDDAGMIEKVITATDSASFKSSLEAGAGCVTNYTTTVDLLPGVKTIYAFSNMDNVYKVDETTETFDSELGDLKEGDTWPDMSDYVMADPAGKIDLEENFIPMSVQQRVDLTVNNQQVSVALVRLVGRVDVVVNNQQGEVSVSKLTLSDFADRVFLFEQAGETKTVPEETINSSYERTFDGGLVIPNSTTTPFELDTFYVNETFGREEAFNVSLELDNDITLSGNTQSWNIERNHILPLRLNLSDLDIVLTITAQIAPIGGYPVTVYTGGESLTDNYQITLPEGCTFTISGKLQSSGGGMQDIASWSWWVGNDNTATSNDVIVLNGIVSNTGDDISGHVTALPGQTATLNFQVYQPNAKNGTLTITTEALQDWNDYTIARAMDWLATPLWYEPVRLTAE